MSTQDWRWYFLPFNWHSLDWIPKQAHIPLSIPISVTIQTIYLLVQRLFLTEQSSSKEAKFFVSLLAIQYCALYRDVATFLLSIKANADLNSSILYLKSPFLKNSLLGFCQCQTSDLKSEVWGPHFPHFIPNLIFRGLWPLVC